MFKRLFKTEDYIGKRKKGYFEGWYFRHSGEYPFSFIAGISRSGDAHSFIQYIDSTRSHYFRFPLEAFSFEPKGMTVTIGGNTFSNSGIHIDIESDGASIKADVNYSNMVKFKKTAFAPSVMGPFTYLPMVCSHCVVSMSHDCEGLLTVDCNAHTIAGKGYIEKDFGSAFPDNYFWTHAESGETSVMFAIAWPLIFGIKGYLCIVSHKGKQYNLSYYTRAKLTGLSITDTEASFKLTKGKTALTFSAKSNDCRQKLIAPARGGNMDIEINENLAADIDLTLIIKGKPVLLTQVTAAFESVLVENPAQEN